MHRTDMIRKSFGRTRSAFTLVELLVVVSIIALLIAILLPSLKKARDQAKSLVCLTNLKGLSTGTMTYATEYGGRLPGPLFPGLYREQTLENYRKRGYSDQKAKNARDRQLTHVLAATMGQRGEGHDGNITDALATCPVQLAVTPDTHFDRWNQANGGGVFPTHYVLNCWGSGRVESGGGGLSDAKPRLTSPGSYFGYSPYDGSPDPPVAPMAMSRIKRASDEWMIADAWFRGRNGPVDFQNDGPYQAGYSGNAFAYAPSHFRKGGTITNMNPNVREGAAAAYAKTKSDGRTGTTFFDGHCESVQSKELTVNGFTIMYGFQGTVNPLYRNQAQGDMIMSTGAWR